MQRSIPLVLLSLGATALALGSESEPQHDPARRTAIESAGSPASRPAPVAALLPGRQLTVPRPLVSHFRGPSLRAAAIPQTGGTLPAGSNPPPGQRIWFLVTAENQYGEGPLQPASSGPRMLDSTGFCGESCAHDMCSTGGALDPACTLCASIVCAKDPHCCSPQGAWDLQCVQQVRTVCRSMQCAASQGQCPHSLCDAFGGPLPPGCDTPPLAVSCTAAVCQADPHCCQPAWDDACIARMATVCGYRCI